MESIFEVAKKHIKPGNIEVFCESWEQDSVNFEMDKLKSVKSQQLDGYSLRIIKDGKIGFTGGTHYDPEWMVKRAVDSAKYGPPAVFCFPDTGKISSPEIFDHCMKNLEMDKIVEKGKEVLEYIKSGRSDIQCDISLEKSVLNERILSGKIDVSYIKTLYSASIALYLFREGDFLSLSDYYSCSKMESREMQIAEKLLALLQVAEREAPISTGVMPVVFSPRGFVDVLRSLLINLNGRMVEKGASPLEGKIGEKILPENISIFDDGTIDGSSTAAPFDDEGLPVYRKPLVKDGILQNFVLDLRSAGMLEMKSTSNAQRGYSNQPRPSPFGVMFCEGEETVESLMRGIKEGLYIEHLIGGHTGNPFTGDFQLNVDLGFKIENGEKVGRVKNVMIAGNFYELFDSLSAFTKKREWVGKYCLPYILFEKLSVAGK